MENSKGTSLDDAKKLIYKALESFSAVETGQPRLGIQLNEYTIEKVLETVYDYRFQDPKYCSDKGDTSNGLTTTHEIFRIPTGEKFTDWKNKKERYHRILERYFRPIELLNEEGLISLEITAMRLEICEISLEKIKKLIKDWELEDHADFVFFLLAKIEECYQRVVRFYERHPISKKEVRELTKEVKALLRVYNIAGKRSGIEGAKIKQIHLTIAKVKPITITSPFLIPFIFDLKASPIDNVTEAKKLNYLKGLPSMIYEKHLNSKAFRNQIISALHQVFKGLEAFGLNNSGVSSDELRAIAEISSLIGFTFRDKEGFQSEYLPGVLDQIRTIIYNSIKG